MPEEILPNLYRIPIPLPKNPLKYMNSYVIKSATRNLLIDTGLNRKTCLEAMQTGLAELDIDLAQTDFFITHFHADHFALISSLAAEDSVVYFNQPDHDFIKGWIDFEALISYARLNGFPEADLRPAIDNHPAHRFGPERIPEMVILPEGHELQAGEYRFTTVQTPGHTPGHMCLYEPQQKVLISGDHLLIDITPNIQCFSDEGNPLKSYLESLEKVERLEVDQVLPGHRRLFKDHRARIEELKQHHARRAQEALQTVQTGPMNAYQVASHMSWDIKFDDWDSLHVSQRWFATGEAISHLRLLEREGAISRLTQDGQTKYRA